MRTKSARGTYKVACDSLIRDQPYHIMSEFNIPAKLIRLCRMTLNSAQSSVKIGKKLSERLDIVRGFRKADPLSCGLFNFVERTGVERNGTFSYKSVQLHVCTNDIDIVGDVTASFTTIEKESTQLSLRVPEGKTKYMQVSYIEPWYLKLRIEVNTYKIDVVMVFIYLGSAITRNNDQAKDNSCQKVLLWAKCANE